MDQVLPPLLLLLLLLFWAPSGLNTASVFRQCPSGQVLSPVDLLCYTCSRCICPDSPVHEGCLSQGLTSSHACLPRQTCTDTTQNAAVAPPQVEMLTKEETNANMVWFLMIFGTLGSFIVLCVAGVGVIECIISVKNCRHSSQHEPANESTGTESGDHEGNNSSQPSSTEEQTNSAYQPDAGLAYQQGACVMVCTAASLSAKLKPTDQSQRQRQRQSSVNETPDHLTDFSQSASVCDAEPVASVSETLSSV